MLRTIEDYQTLYSNIHEIHTEDVDHHSYSVATLARAFGRFLRLNEKDIKRLYIGAHLHDLGKIFFDQELLEGAGLLTDEQKNMIHYHPIRGFMLAFKTIRDEKILEIILYHHERIDGNGYPYNLLGQEIPYLTKIVTICDAFNAMISARGYKETRTIEEAMIELNKNKGSQFDVQLIEAFLLFIKQKDESVVLT